LVSMALEKMVSGDDRNHVLWGSIDSDSESEASDADTSTTAPNDDAGQLEQLKVTSEIKAQFEQLRVTSRTEAGCCGDLAKLKQRSINPDDVIFSESSSTEDEKGRNTKQKNKTKKRQRPHKHQRLRYHQFREQLFFSIDGDPDGFDLDTLEIPLFIASDPVGKEKFVHQLELRIEKMKAWRLMGVEPIDNAAASTSE